jgi:hypothetical protein
MSLQSFQASDQSFHQFLAAVRKAIEGRELGKMVHFDAPPEPLPGQSTSFNLRVVITKMGTSNLNFRIHQSPNGSGFTAQLESEKIILTHRPFRREIESKLARVLESCGATIGP